MSAPSRPVLVIGSLNMDLIATCDRLPAPGETVAGSGFRTAPGGKGANQAVAAARLGARVSLAGCVGRDAFGRALRAGVRGAGVETGALASVAAPTGTALIAVDAQGRNQIVVVAGANARCDAALIDRALAAQPEPGLLLLQHEIPPASVAHAIRAGAERGWFVLLNPAPARTVPTELLARIDLIAPNETEAQALTGLPVRDRAEAELAARALLAGGARAALITLGAAGALYVDAGGARFVDPVSVRAVDTTGAGDAFLGGFAAARSAGGSLDESLGFAAAAAALSATRPGAQGALPTRVEVDRFRSRD